VIPNQKAKLNTFVEEILESLMIVVMIVIVIVIPIFHVSLLEPYYINEFANRNNRKRKNTKLTIDTINKVPEIIIDMRTYRKKLFPRILERP